MKNLNKLSFITLLFLSFSAVNASEHSNDNRRDSIINSLEENEGYFTDTPLEDINTTETKIVNENNSILTDNSNSKNSMGVTNEENLTDSENVMTPTNSLLDGLPTKKRDSRDNTTYSSKFWFRFTSFTTLSVPTTIPYQAYLFVGVIFCALAIWKLICNIKNPLFNANPFISA